MLLKNWEKGQRTNYMKKWSPLKSIKTVEKCILHDADQKFKWTLKIF